MTLDWFLLKDKEDWIRGPLGDEPWFNAYLWQEGGVETVELFSALIPAEASKKVLRDAGWDVVPGHGLPIELVTTTVGKNRSREIRKYLRCGNEYGIQPLVILRQFSGIKPGATEILEEFRLFHNLYYDPRRDVYTKINDNADEEDVIRLKKDSVQIRTDAVMRFLQARKANLALYFRFYRQREVTLDSIGTAKTCEVRHGKGLIYRFGVDASPQPPPGLVAGLEGKKLITPPQRRQGKDRREYETFIVATGANGKELMHTCDPSKLANYFGANPDAPQYTTTIFFRRAILSKYYENPLKYLVQDSHLSCGHFWWIRIDNNHKKYVTAMLGDLGRDLPIAEQKYWRSFNVRPDGSMSAVSFKRDFLCGFAIPSQNDLVFKEAYESFQKLWEGRFGWPLFKPFLDSDAHYLSKMHVPFTEEQSEFDEQVEALNKILVESFNDAELLKCIHPLVEGEKKPKSIEKLKRFLDEKQISDYQAHIEFLRWLYRLRHGTPHRKGEDYNEAAEWFCISENGHIAAFISMLEKATALLKYLQDCCITN